MGLKTRLLDQGWLPKTRRQDAGPAMELVHPEYQGSIGLILPYSPDFCSSCNRLRVSSQGKLHLCLFGEEGYDLRHLMRKDRVPELIQALDSKLMLKHETHYLD